MGRPCTIRDFDVYVQFERIIVSEPGSSECFDVSWMFRLVSAACQSFRWFHILVNRCRTNLLGCE
jgi:hypothetical protein